MRSASWPATGVAALGAVSVVVLALDNPVSLVVALATWAAAALGLVRGIHRAPNGRVLVTVGIALAAVVVVTWTVWVLGVD